MSKSYRKPYASVTGCRSAADDKLVARRCWRRTQEQALRDCQDWEELIVPKRLEASFNNVYSWGRDGKQRLRFLDPNDFNPYHCMLSSTYWTEQRIHETHEKRLARRIAWMAEIQRK